LEHIEMVTKYLTEPGVEIGAFLTPIPGIKPIYLDRFQKYANELTLADYYGDACEIPCHDSSLNYVASSHLIEHVANPLAAFEEWFRVLKHGGIIYMVVPDRTLTFDHPRALTPIKHIIEDYRNNVTQVDSTHIEEFAFGVDWKLFSPATEETDVSEQRKQQVLLHKSAIDSRTEINIHFHTFEIDSMKELIEIAGDIINLNGKIKIEEIIPRFPDSNPDGFLFVCRIYKPFYDRALAFSKRLLFKDRILTDKIRRFKE